MADLPQSDEGQKYLSCVGGIIVQWTSIETFVQSAIAELSGDPKGNYTLVAGLDGVRLTTLLRVVVDDKSPEDFKPHFERIAKAMDICRNWRNYIAHSLRGVTFNPSYGMVGSFEQSAGQFTDETKQDKMTLSEIESVLAEFNRVEKYTRDVQSAFVFRPFPEISPSYPGVPLPDELLKLPSPLKKTKWDPRVFGPGH